MKLRVLAFASAAEAIGASSTEIEIAAESSVADLRRHLQTQFPELGGLWERLAIAVDGELAQSSTPLRDGAEVALLPPVSGGLPEGRTHLTQAALDPKTVIAEVSDASRGAVLLFLGAVRDNHRGRAVSRLTYEAYDTMAEKVLRAIEADAGAKGVALRIVHRLGDVPAGEASVVIAAASPHRAAAYEASREALERLKREAPIWKREHYAGGEAVWREEEPLTPSP